jgi:hypothetical protein
MHRQRQVLREGELGSGRRPLARTAGSRLPSSAWPSPPSAAAGAQPDSPGGGLKRPRSALRGGSDSEEDDGGGAAQGSMGVTHRRGGRSRPHANVTELGPAVPCSDETCIFQALGLAYVPPHMRG